MKVASLVCGFFVMATLVNLSSGRAFARISSAVRRPVVMMPLPARLLTRCRSAFVLRPVCPRLNPESLRTARQRAKRAVPESIWLHRLRSRTQGATREADFAQSSAWSAASDARGGTAARQPVRRHGLPRIEGNHDAKERSEHANATPTTPVRNAAVGRASWGTVPRAVVPLRWPDRRPSHLLVAQGKRRLRRQHPRVGTADGNGSGAARDHRLDALKARTVRT